MLFLFLLFGVLALAVYCWFYFNTIFPRKDNCNFVIDKFREVSPSGETRLQMEHWTSHTTDIWCHALNLSSHASLLLLENLNIILLAFLCLQYLVSLHGLAYFLLIYFTPCITMKFHCYACPFLWYTVFFICFFMDPCVLSLQRVMAWTSRLFVLESPLSPPVGQNKMWMQWRRRQKKPRPTFSRSQTAARD